MMKKLSRAEHRGINKCLEIIDALAENCDLLAEKDAKKFREYHIYEAAALRTASRRIRGLPGYKDPNATTSTVADERDDRPVVEKTFVLESEQQWVPKK